MCVSLIVVFLVWIFMGTSTELETVSVKGYDPGKCDQDSHGKLIMIKDRQNKDKLLVCAEENQGYIWKTTDGSNPTGEFFSPAYDCTDALEKNDGLKDGIYWIKLSGNVPKRVWCDMTTDGGGWILIGRKNSSVTWTVPSNNNTVEPFGEPHWSSSLGDAPMVDFRVQVATQEDFGTTRAHWSFRMQKKRALKNLLMISEGGCLSPGIGDIAYVKDLQTEEIVTTTFRCSHFSSYEHWAPGFGWDMLNYCLAHPCPLGFAFHKDFPVQIDYSGAFSYSASANTSGIGHDSTSFVGCENHKCCGCFGPVGGKKNYCGTLCNAKNSGTVVKNVYTWFWVRSSLTKKLWNKCMEYKVTGAGGKEIWYKLHKGRAIPVMGRCDQSEVLLNDGVVVVQDKVAAQKVPHVPGLLQYRKDNKKFYIRSNGTWNVIGEEKKVLKYAAQQIKPKLDQVEKLTMQQNTEFTQLKKSLADLKSQLKSVNKTVDDMKQKVLGESCASLYNDGVRLDGVYDIDPDRLGSFKVRCDMSTDGGGWTVFQRRVDASVDFYRQWKDYKIGFGDLNGNFWLGLDKIHRLSKSGQNILRVDLHDFNNGKAYAKYTTFTVASESESYKLKVGGYSGDAGDSLKYHNGMKFTTKDRKNDLWGSGNCAVAFHGAWWYKSCYQSNLNGQYLGAGQTSSKGIRWNVWKTVSMKKAEMKIRPAQF